ncbi:MAG: NAD-binding protein, partial [Rhodobacteraceae bacterium]|nr:NAD-binding protein [Paracoccaceae bacterium]
MKILIVGAGQVGSQICRYLVREMDCEITVLDNNSDNVGLITDKLNIIGVVGEGTRGEDLKRSGIKNTNLIVAVTPSDEANVLSTFFARKLNPDIQTIARIRNTDYHEFVSEKNDGFIDIIINPEGAVAAAAQRLLRSKQLFFYQNLFNGKAQVIGLNLSEKSSVLNTSLRQLSETFEGLRTFVVGYRRNNVLQLANPDDQLIEGDKVYLIAASDDLERTLEIFGVEKSPFHRVIVIGGGKIGLDFTKRAEKNFNNYHLKLIEKDKGRAEAIAGELTRAIVLQGDGMEEDL